MLMVSIRTNKILIYLYINIDNCTADSQYLKHFDTHLHSLEISSVIFTDAVNNTGVLSYYNYTYIFICHKKL